MRVGPTCTLKVCPQRAALSCRVLLHELKIRLDHLTNYALKKDKPYTGRTFKSISRTVFPIDTLSIPYHTIFNRIINLPPEVASGAYFYPRGISFVMKYFSKYIIHRSPLDMELFIELVLKSWR